MPCAVGAQNVQAVDPVSGLRSWEQTTAQLSGPRVPPAIVLDQPRGRAVGETFPCPPR